ncbi:DUF2852 domain-containing protein [Rhodophyticola sp. CCM32]|uniref:DUF2852 domain-containing protein n=1 Tax=Rhodophyticola sp. CCM32 TaxID=2916397 RepID=UPI00107F499B|nr:DUF2852 domain-containing protein [Rhodophyticola sp. CCM32]QBY00709.1 DUF2852 domain-containing protein [Rhodophyticola sp. CCM32]
MTSDTQTDPADHAPAYIPLPVQILTLIFYAGFAISVSIVAMALFGVIGVVLAVLFAWQWARLPALNGQAALNDRIKSLRPNMPAPEPQSSGNASFDAYRDALMRRLEQEQAEFEGFLTRLREAKDKSEFDRFLDKRAATNRGSQDSATPAMA